MGKNIKYIIGAIAIALIGVFTLLSGSSDDLLGRVNSGRTLSFKQCEGLQRLMDNPNLVQQHKVRYEQYFNAYNCAATLKKGEQPKTTEELKKEKEQQNIDRKKRNELRRKRAEERKKNANMARQQRTSQKQARIDQRKKRYQSMDQDELQQKLEKTRDAYFQRYPEATYPGVAEKRFQNFLDKYELTYNPGGNEKQKETPEPPQPEKKEKPELPKKEEGDSTDEASTTYSGGTVELSFNSRTDSKYKHIALPTGTCADASCATSLAEFEVKSVGEDLILRKFSVWNDDDNENFEQRIGTLFLIDKDSGNVIDTASISDWGGEQDGVITFDGFAYELHNATPHNFEVKGEINPLTRASHTGAFTKLYLVVGDSDESEDVYNPYIQVRNMSDTVLPLSAFANNADNGDGYQQFHVIRKSKPIITYNNDELGDSITGSTAQKSVYKFTMSADEKGAIEWHTLTFNITEESGISSSNYKLYDETGSEIVSSITSDKKVRITPHAVQNIAAGNSVTYILKADIEVTDTVHSKNISFELTAENDTEFFQRGSSGSISSAEFVWSDIADKYSHSVDSQDWTNGYLLEGFDDETHNIRYQGTG